jgi:hypothetical protein
LGRLQRAIVGRPADQAICHTMGEFMKHDT